MNRKKRYSRAIQASWYKKFPWITVYTSSYKIFFHNCRIAKKKGLITSFKSSTFVDNGFSNWKKALEKFEEHERSDNHREAVAKVAAFFNATDVGAQLSAVHKKTQLYKQRMLLKLLFTVQFLAQQGLSLRGHLEDVNHLEGNLYKLLLLRTEDCPELKSWIYKKQYTSPEIVNEIITIMGHKILDSLLVHIKRSLWFSIIADEATDISGNEQMSLSIRYVDR